MQFFKDRNLNIAIFISASCHLICLLSIIPILASGVARKDPAVISFLGSIMEKVSAVPEKTFNLHSFSHGYHINIRRYNDPKGDVLRSPDIASKTFPPKPDKEKIVPREEKYDFSALRIDYSRKKGSHIRFKDFVITGKAKERTLLYKPPLPTVSVFNAYFSSGYAVSVKFKVSAHGFIEQPECLTSSGSPEVDNMAMRYIRRWQFVPSYKETDAAEEGIARLNFDTL